MNWEWKHERGEWSCNGFTIRVEPDGMFVISSHPYEVEIAQRDFRSLDSAFRHCQASVIRSTVDVPPVVNAVRRLIETANYEDLLALDRSWAMFMMHTNRKIANNVKVLASISTDESEGE